MTLYVSKSMEISLSKLRFIFTPYLAFIVILNGQFKTTFSSRFHITAAKGCSDFVISSTIANFHQIPTSTTLHLSSYSATDANGDQLVVPAGIYRLLGAG